MRAMLKLNSGPLDELIFLPVHGYFIVGRLVSDSRAYQIKRAIDHPSARRMLN